MKRLILILALIFSCLWSAQGGAGHTLTQPPWPAAAVQGVDASLPLALPSPYLWPESTPEAQGVDEAVLSQAFEQASKLGYMYSVLVIKNGFLIGERYYNQKDRNFAGLTCSTAKSYISALIGIALANHDLSSLNQKMMDFFPEYASPGLDARKYDITVGQLLTMRSGLPQEETGTLMDDWFQSEDMMKFAVECPLASEPGQQYHYSTLGTHILSGILTKATGMTTLDYAQKYLFAPLKITIAGWDQDPKGYYTGGWGMYFTPRDMARLGYLYLQDGTVEGVRILDPGWIQESHQKYSTDVVWYQKHFIDWGYGYLWWLARAGGYDIQMALGYGGQTIVNVPDLNMIIVTTADWDIPANQSGIQINAVFDLIHNYLLAPLKCLSGPPPYFPSALSAQKINNSGLAYREYINLIRWQPNPRNVGVNISKYRIYRVSDESRRLLAEVNAGTLEYWQRNIDRHLNYVYAVSAVTEDGLESTPAYVSIR